MTFLPSYRLRDQEQELVDRYKWIDWVSPVIISGPDGEPHMGCRYCIALHGIKEPEIRELPITIEEHDSHIRVVHYVENS